MALPPVITNFLRKISIDVAALSIITVTAVGVLCEAATRTSLGDAQSPRECRYPPLSSIVTRGEWGRAAPLGVISLLPFRVLFRVRIISSPHVRELEKNNVVVIDNVLSPSTLRYARARVESLSAIMEPSPNDADVRQDVILSIKEDDEYDYGDALIHCIKLLRGIPYLLDRFDYVTSRSHVVPRQCQLAMYRPDGSAAYVRHLDRCTLPMAEMGLLGWLRASDYRHRVVTAILYLNSPDWIEGGELRLFDGAATTTTTVATATATAAVTIKHTDIVPSGGKLVLFDSSRVEHQVLASLGEDRYALTCCHRRQLDNITLYAVNDAIDARQYAFNAINEQGG
ncbi:hypothetical protein ACHAW5_003677 [Stephanodiscus triporus]|uniref:Fe2OG dioxygenase domain-containing protein n=1 Tax=Stephanodiscus triporus TaxID=2934178 RepID=A0ABD3NH59_9STRA